MKTVIYVIKNVKTGKYYVDDAVNRTRWTKNPYLAQTYTKEWVDDITAKVKAGEDMMEKNEKFVKVEITAKEVK